MLRFPRSSGGRLALAWVALFLVACGGPAPLTDGDDAAPPPRTELADGGDAGIVVRANDAGDAGVVVEPDAADASVVIDAADAAELPDVSEMDAADAADAQWEGPADAADAADTSVDDAADAADASVDDAADAADTSVVDTADAADASVDDAADAADTSVDDAADAADVSVVDAADAALPDQDGDGVPDDLDCAPNDRSSWQWLPYAYRDADHDGRTVPAAAGAQICTGAGLPVGYSNVPGDPDCDDTQASVWAWLDGYVDEDHDGVGSTELAHLCTDGHLPTGYAATSGDCAPGDGTRWQMLAYAYRDADNDGFTVPAAGSICSGRQLPTGYATQPSGDDCNDADPSVWNAQTLFVDGDHDGVGAGPSVSLCVAVSPVGYSPHGGDCDDGDPLRWQMLAYSYRDADGDGYTVAATGTVCTGATLPAGFATSGSGSDCDDANPQIYVDVTLFVDVDNDGVGAGTGSVQCLGNTDPAGYAEVGGDCAPTDPKRYYLAAYSYVDRDNDGATVPEQGSFCGDGSLPPPYFTSANGLDCDDTNPALDHFGAGYSDSDHDGFGAGRSLALCLGVAIPVGYSQFGTDEDDGDPSVTENLDDDLDLFL